MYCRICYVINFKHNVQSGRDVVLALFSLQYL